MRKPDEKPAAKPAHPEHPSHPVHPEHPAHPPPAPKPPSLLAAITAAGSQGITLAELEKQGVDTAKLDELADAGLIGYSVQNGTLAAHRTG